MNYSEAINDIFDPLEGLTKSEALDYLDDNEESIKDEIFAAIVLFLGISKPIYKKTSITIFNETKRIIRREFKSLDEKKLKKQKVKKKKDFVIDSNILAQVKMRNQHLFTNAKEFNQQVLKQEHFISKAKEQKVLLLYYVLNEKSQNHCPYCVENNRIKVYAVSNAPELPQKEGHGGVGYGCYCYYRPINSKSDIEYYMSIDKDLTFRKDWWKDKHIKHLFDDDLTNGELPD